MSDRPSRRQTLAGLSPSQLNTRGNGQAAGRVTKDAPKGRKSMAAGLERPSLTGLDRRSSAFNGKTTGPKQDPRPLTDKNFFNNCIRTIITYLSSHNFPAAVSPKTLQSPTGKDFSVVVQFLLQQYDPSFRITNKIEDEVPIFFKRLNYPFQISKSALFAVGSPHSWPAVLAALTWLVEILNYQEKAAESPESASFDKDSKNREQFLSYLAQGYNAFMSGNDQKCEQLDEQLVHKFRVRGQELDANTEKTRQAHAAVLTEIEALKAAPDPVVAAQQRMAQQLVDKEKFEKLIQNLEEFKQTLTRKQVEKQADLRSRQDQLAATARETNQLKHRIASQTTNKADLNRMILERNKQRTVLESEKAKCENLERKVHEQEVQILGGLDLLEATAERYNKLAHRLKLIPATAKRADGITYELRINRDATSPLDFFNLDLKGVIKPGLERLCHLYRTKVDELGQDLTSLREHLHGHKERKAEREQENQHLANELAMTEAKLQAARDILDERVRQLGAKAEVIKGHIEQLRHAASNKIGTVEERLARAQAEHEQTQRDCDAELSRLDTDLRTALKMVLNHKQSMSALISGAAKAVQQTRRETTQLPILQMRHA